MSWINRNVVFNILLVCGAIGFALLVSEIGIRVVFPSTIKLDPILGYTGNAGKDDWDARGFRNSTALATATIVVLGDSQTHGNNATREEAWPQVLGKLATTSVYQMAVGGWGPVQEAYMIDQVIAMHPRLVILAPYLGNDMLDAYNLTYTLDYWKTLRDPKFIAPNDNSDDSADVRAMIQTGLPKGSLMLRIYRIRLWLRNNIRVYELMGNATRDLRERIGVAKTMEEKRAQVSLFAKEHPDVAYIYDKEPKVKTYMSGVYRKETVDLASPKTQEGWRIAKGRYDEIIQKLHEAGVPLLVVIIPTKEAVYITHMKEKREEVPVALGTYMLKETDLSDAITRYFSDQHIPVIHLLDAMSEALNNGVVVYGQTIDGHPLPDGYRVIAEEVFTRLQEGIPYPR